MFSVKFLFHWITDTRGRIQRKTWCMVYVGVDYNFTLCPLQSRLQHIYHGQPYARVDFIPPSGTLDLASAELSAMESNRVQLPGSRISATYLYKVALHSPTERVEPSPPLRSSFLSLWSDMHIKGFSFPYIQNLALSLTHANIIHETHTPPPSLSFARA